MYIPWIIVIAIGLGIYYFSKIQKTKGTLPVFCPFSYKLDINLEPDWDNLYKKVAGIGSKEELGKILEKKIKALDYESDLWGRRYQFTEYYDSSSGLIVKLQKTLTADGKQTLKTVDEFGDGGFIFTQDRDNAFMNEKLMGGRLALDIDENSIRNNVFDKFVGGRRLFFDKEDYVYEFPLNEVFEFLFALGQRFDGAERNTIVKWPDSIEQRLKALGIKYEPFFDSEPSLFDIEKYDKEFYEEHGKPKITSRDYDGHYLSSQMGFYAVKLTIFKPNDNPRLKTNARQ